MKKEIIRCSKCKKPLALSESEQKQEVYCISCFGKKLQENVKKEINSQPYSNQVGTERKTGNSELQSTATAKSISKGVVFPADNLFQEQIKKQFAEATGMEFEKNERIL